MGVGNGVVRDLGKGAGWDGAGEIKTDLLLDLVRFNYGTMNIKDHYGASGGDCTEK